MPLSINSDLETRLAKCLREGLPHVRSQHNFRVTPESMVHLLKGDVALPDKGELKKQLDRIISPNMPFIDFVGKWLSSRLRDECDYNVDETQVALMDLPPFQNIDLIAAQVLAEFRSLPHPYTVYTQMSDALSPAFCQLAQPFLLSPSITIASGAHWATHGAALTHPNAKRNERLSIGENALVALLNPQPLSWQAGTAYIAIEASGYIDEFGDTETFDVILRQLKSFFGLGIVAGIFSAPAGYTAKPSISRRHLVCRGGAQGDKGHIENLVRFDDDLSSITEAVAINDAIKNDPNPEERLILHLNFMKGAFQDTDRYRKILRAAEWLGDSYGHHNHLLRFVQRMVCLEILLGDRSVSDDVGIGKLLASRCAYLVGKDFGQREEILKDFPQIYNLRSKIVHDGVSRIPPGDWTYVEKLRRLCSLVLWKELDLIRLEARAKRENANSGGT